jgi:hypothetical protein
MNILQIAKPVYATICNPVLTNCSSSETPKAYFNSALQGIISIFFLVGVIYFLWHFIFAGYHLIATNGDPKNFETAKNELVYACVGLLVVFSVFAVLKFVGIVVGIPGLESLQIAWPTL